MSRYKAFTLIEVLVVVAIIALLISITMPSLAAVRRNSQRTKCRHNLHQIGVAMECYLHESNDTFPMIASFPSKEPDIAVSEGGREPFKPMSEVLRKQVGVAVKSETVSEVFLCPADEISESSQEYRDLGLYRGNRYFDTETTSYQWNAFLNPDFDSERNQIGPPKQRGFRRMAMYGGLAHSSLSKLHMIYEFEAFHAGRSRRGSTNYLYADMHVGSSN